MRMRSFAHALAVIGLVSTAACGGAGSSTGAASTPTAAPTPPPVVKTAMATVDGKSMTILVDAEKGMTLYWFTPDKGAGKVTCTGGCLSVWPPLELTDATTKPTGGAGVTGTLGTITDPNGKPMVTYNGWPVYFYAKDKSPGDTTGQNVGQKWFVVTPDLTPNA